MSLVKTMLVSAMIAHFQAGGTVDPPSVDVPPVQQVGVASWYGRGTWHGDVTANGEQFDPNEYTCAHRNLPFDTVVLVENRANGRRAWCRINDRGPYDVEKVDGEWKVRTNSATGDSWRGVIDLSAAMARELRMKQAGLQRVYLRYWARDAAGNYQLALLSP